MIHLEGINKTYFNGAPLHVLKGIDLDIERGKRLKGKGKRDGSFSPRRKVF